MKPENILLRGDSEIKLTDFGLAKQDSDGRLQTFCGTPQYFAPEVLRRAHTIHGRGRYGKPADLWSLGVVLYVLLTGCTPEFDAQSKLQWDPADESISGYAKDLILKLLDPNPTSRATVQQCCEHAWVLIPDKSDTHQNPLDDPALGPSEVPTKPDTKDGAEKTMSAPASTGSLKRPPLSPVNSHRKKTKAGQQLATSPVGKCSLLFPTSSGKTKNVAHKRNAVSPLVDGSVFDTPSATLAAATLRRVSGSTLKTPSNMPNGRTEDNENAVYSR